MSADQKVIEAAYLVFVALLLGFAAGSLYGQRKKENESRDSKLFSLSSQVSYLNSLISRNGLDKAPQPEGVPA